MKAFKICYVSSEVLPFANTGNTGGLAETSKSLPVALKEMDQDIRLMMPKYKSINERKYVLREVIRLREVKIDIEGNTKLANGKTAFLPNSKVHVYFLSIPEYFDKKGFYIDPQTRKEYPDNTERFAYFCKGVLETLKLLYWQPDIIHCSDWPTALIPFYLKTHYKNDAFFKNTHTLLTVHDFASQGIYPLENAAQIGISEAYTAPGKEFELDGKLNLLKGGLLFADSINTVSEQSVTSLISEPETGHGLSEVLSSRKKELYGISNGADYTVWDPETDTNIPVQYDAKLLDRKAENKAELRSEFDLQDDPSIPLIATIGELNEGNGFDLILDAIEDLLKLKIHFVVMGNGESEYSRKLEKIAKQHSSKLVFHGRFDNRLAHLILAGADMMLLPYKTTPNEGFHLESLHYGTVPIGKEIGGFADNVKDFDPDSGKGNGFTFTTHKKSDMMKAVKTALKLFKDEKTWVKIQKNGMRADFSWDAAAKKYLKLYEKIAKKK